MKIKRNVSFQVVEDESYYETSSLLGRIVYMTPVFFNFRMRLYTGFVLSGDTDHRCLVF